MLPVQAVLPSRHRPWITFTVIGSGLGVLLYELTLSTPELRGLIFTLGLVPAEASWPTALTSLLLHQDVAQATANMVALWIFGDNLEDRLGSWRYALLFLACGLLAAMAAVGVAPDSHTPLAGLSGSVAGVIGGHLALWPRSRVFIFVPLWRAYDLVEVPALLVVAFWLFFQGIGQAGLMPGAAPFAGTLVTPLVGCAAGVVAGRLLCRRDRMDIASWNRPSVR